YVLRSQATDKIHQSANGFFPFSACVIRVAGPVDLHRQLRETIAGADPQVPIVRIRSIQQILSDSLVQERFNMFLMSAFAAVALILTTVGLYGVLSYQVTQRTREIGVRVALGATRGQILRIIAGRGMALLGLGIVIGLAIAVGFMHLLAGL